MMQDAVRAYRRRAILSLLEYDSDYRLSLDMLDLCKPKSAGWKNRAISAAAIRRRT